MEHGGPRPSKPPGAYTSEIYPLAVLAFVVGIDFAREMCYTGADQIHLRDWGAGNMAGKKRMPARMKAKKEWKPQGFTRKEWITIGIVLGAILLLVLGYFLLRDFFDGSLRIADGKVQTDANSIVVSTGTTDKPKYFKLGSVSEVDGYTMTAEPYLSDANVPAFQYTPSTPSAISNVTILAAKGQAQDMAGKVAANYGAYLQNAVSSEVTQVTVGGRTGWAFSCDYDEPQEEAAATPAPDATVAPEATPAPDATVAPEATPAPDATVAPEATPAATAAPAVKAARLVSIYLDASRGMSVLSSITARADTKDQLPSVEDMYKAMEPFIQGLTIDGEAQPTAAPTAAVTAEPTPAA